MNIFELLCAGLVLAVAVTIAIVLGATYGLLGYVLGALAGGAAGLCFFYIFVALVAALASTMKSNLFWEAVLVIDPEIKKTNLSSNDLEIWLIENIINSGYQVTRYGNEDERPGSIRFCNEYLECYCKICSTSDGHHWRCILKYDP